MKVIHSFTCLAVAASLILTGCDQGPCSCEFIQVPDQALLDALLEPGLDGEGEVQNIDSNDDGLISHAEAEAITFLDVSDKGISDMTGIENFINLEVLDCSDNFLIELDLSRNRKLKELDVSNMPTLTGVCVWELPWPPENILIHVNGSPNIYFTDECSL